MTEIQIEAATTTSSTTPTTEPAAPDTTWVAQAQVSEVPIFDQPDAPEPVQTLPNPDPNGVPLVFLVAEPPGDGAWVHVNLPVEPTGSAGWIRRSDVVLVTNSYRVTVELDAHQLTVTDGGAVQLQVPIAVGQDDAPEAGMYYIKELLQMPDPEGAYGTYAYGLSGYPISVAAIHAGTGVVGIHGTNDPDTLGGDVTNGSIGVANDAINQMVGRLPLGTPVEVHP